MKKMILSRIIAEGHCAELLCMPPLALLLRAYELLPSIITYLHCISLIILVKKFKICATILEH